MAGDGPRAAARSACRSRSTRLYFEPDGTLPEPRGRSAQAREPARPVRRGAPHAARTSASPSTATATAPSSSTSRRSRSPSDLVTALLARRHAAPAIRAGACSTTCARAASTAEEIRGGRRRPGDVSRRPLLHEGAHARGRRDLRGRALRPLLLPLLGDASRRRRDRRVRGAARRARRASGARSRELVAPLRRYAASGEINRRVDDVPRVLAAIEAEHAGAPEISHLDGLRVAYPDWWFNLRPSNTEPVLRLNLEADDARAHGRAPRRAARADRGPVAERRSPALACRCRRLRSPRRARSAAVPPRAPALAVGAGARRRCASSASIRR